MTQLKYNCTLLLYDSCAYYYKFIVTIAIMNNSIYKPLKLWYTHPPCLYMKEITQTTFNALCYELRKTMKLQGDDDSITDTIEYYIWKLALRGDVMVTHMMGVTKYFVVKDGKYVDLLNIKLKSLSELIE